MIIIFDWLGDIISGIGDAIGNAIDVVESGIANAIWNAMLRWIYEIIYGAIADCFEMIGGMSAEVFDLEWVQATVKLFTLFGWGLFVAGTVVAVFDVAIEYQCGRANIKTTALNILKGFFACSLIGVVPIELYKFCISLQNTFSHDLIGIASSGINSSLADVGLSALVRLFSPSIGTTLTAQISVIPSCTHRPIRRNISVATSTANTAKAVCRSSTDDAISKAPTSLFTDIT